MDVQVVLIEPGDDGWPIECVEERVEDVSYSDVEEEEIILPGPDIPDYHFIDPSEWDTKNEEAIEDLYKDSGSCCETYRCNQIIPKELALKHRYTFMEMTKKEQDLVVLSHLQLHRRVTDLLTYYGERTQRKACRVKKKETLLRKGVKYYFCDIPICKKMYLFLHDVGTHRFKNLCKHFDDEGLAPRVHKLTNVKPTRKKCLKVTDIENVVAHIKSFAAEAPSDRVSHRERPNVLRIPSNQSKALIHRLYLNAIESRPEFEKLARSTFVNIWKKYCPNVIIMRPAGPANSSSDAPKISEKTCNV